ncbi:bifunctional DNA primase/polymerase [Mycobacteroides chelonae]|uniref:bifunctional DNA primase/polymerase n=1 Tax=Mycobacteroides chelonae TaxID=1774 RepID=UPI003876741B
MKNTKISAVRADSLATLLSTAPEADDHDAMRGYLHALTGAGCAPLLVYPHSKMPADMRASRVRSADDAAARDAARQAGNRNWAKVKSAAGVHLATGDTAVLDGYLDEYVRVFADQYPDGVPVNVALSVGRSRLVVVDCDTADQVAAFLSDAGAPADTEPTVRSPGQANAEGEMVHKDGGHFYFTVPEGVELPENLGTLTDADGGYAVLWGAGRYVLIPPSVRAEGPYAAAGAVHELPDWLAERITGAGQIRAQRAAQRLQHASASGDAIAAWGASITWAEILAGTEWISTGRADSCGCDIWTAPGLHASTKSATAHEPGCAVADSDDPCMHVWTDHDIEPFEAVVAQCGPHLTRLRAVAAIHFDNDQGTAMTVMDLNPKTSQLGFGEFGTAAAADEDGPGLNLPPEFWQAHPVLAHIRRFAHHDANGADPVFGAALARLSANLDPSVRVDTGVKRPMQLNMFTGLVGSAGTGKSSAFQASDDLFDFKRPDPTATDLIYVDGGRPPELPVGTGPGLAEAFMGVVVDPLDPKVKRREQVRHKVLFVCDEGAALVAGILDNKRGMDIGPTLRVGWTGAVLGQQNASAERTRQVRDYTLGLCVGFQLEAVADLSTPEQMEYGTPQRFVYFSATDPAIPDEAGDHPGPLTIKLPAGVLRYDAELRARARREALARARGEGDSDADPMQAHRPALTARLAALLVILCDPGRTEIHAADVALAETILDTSARLHSSAVDWRRERESAAAERRMDARIGEQVATAAAVADKDQTLAELGVAVLRYLDGAGGSMRWGGKTGIKQKIRSNRRYLADPALGRLVGNGKVAYDEDADLVTKR